MSENKFYLTTPIYYVNARPHIGHAYTTIVADVLARRHRVLGDDTFFLTGTDEHGQKIERSAAAAGMPPQQFADSVSSSFEGLWKRMGITNDAYIRTTDEKHKRGVQHLFSELYKNGFIYLASYTGSYCVSDEAFVDAPVGTPCPDCGRLLEEVTEENFFFKLSAFQRPLLDLIESDTIAITPESRKNEVLSFLRGNVHAPPDMERDPVQEKVSEVLFSEIFDAEGGKLPTRSKAQQLAIDRGDIKRSALGSWFVPGALKDLSISRSSFTWGIPVPEPAASAASQKHVIYVWLDALANYMTAIGYGSDDPSDQAEFKRLWPAELHLVGKEIIRFHCVYWPAFLLALNPKLQHKSGEEPPTLTLEEHKTWAKEWLPKAITAHGWLLFDNSKMSKSKGNIVRTETILDAFGNLLYGSAFPNSAHAEQDLFAADVLRYFLLREIPFGQDGSFSFDALITRYNADLANGYGNLVSRVLKMVSDYFDGVIPSPQPMRPLVRTIMPDWWTSDPLAGQAEFSGDVNPEPPYQASPAPSPQYRYIAIRDAKKRIGLSLDTELVVHDGQHFYGITNGLNIWEFFQAAVDPLLRLANQSSWTENLTRVIEFIAEQIKVVDEFLSLSRPWKLTEEDPRRAYILGVAAEYLRLLTAALYPILPYATARVWAQLGLGDIEADARNGKLRNLQWGGLKHGTKLGPLGPIFPRADKGLAQIMTDMENPTHHITENEQRLAEVKQQKTLSTDPAAPPRTSSLDSPAGALPVGGSTALSSGPAATPSHAETVPSAPFGSVAAQTPITAAPTDASPQITIDDFAKIELRVAQILVAERIPKANKLLRLEVDLGYEKRQILSGIAEWYTPEELVGRRIVVITNLAPRKMRGLESHGMLLAASDAEHGKPHLATCGEEIALGARLK
jgi:methionyl-tRNA synthetase